jgi:hypothetical protein
MYDNRRVIDEGIGAVGGRQGTAPGDGSPVGLRGVSRRPVHPISLCFTCNWSPREGGRVVLTGVPVGGLALTPDGKTAAYIVERGGKAELWIARLDGTGGFPLPGVTDAAFPFGPQTAAPSRTSRRGNSCGRNWPAAGESSGEPDKSKSIKRTTVLRAVCFQLGPSGENVQPRCR